MLVTAPKAPRRGHGHPDQLAAGPARLPPRRGRVEGSWQSRFRGCGAGLASRATVISRLSGRFRLIPLCQQGIADPGELSGDFGQTWWQGARVSLAHQRLYHCALPGQHRSSQGRAARLEGVGRPCRRRAVTPFDGPPDVLD